ncbi:hypothetical protein [uncultured Nostoc sp.]
MTICEVITAGKQLQISKAIANLFGQVRDFLELQHKLYHVRLKTYH